MKFKFGKPQSWIVGLVVVVAGGYYFLKIRPKQQENNTLPPPAVAPSNVVNQAIENIGSKRVRAYASRRLPKIKKARGV